MSEQKNTSEDHQYDYLNDGTTKIENNANYVGNKAKSKEITNHSSNRAAASTSDYANTTDPSAEKEREDNTSKTNSSSSKQRSTRKFKKHREPYKPTALQRLANYPVKTGATLMVLATAAATLGSLVIVPAIHKHNAETRLKQVVSNYGSVTPINTSMSNFSGPKLSGTTSNQKQLNPILAPKSTVDNTAVIQFGNGKHYNKIVDWYIDFSNIQNRWNLLENENLLKANIESGNIELNIHPVPTKDPYSFYAPEAIMESFVVSPQKSWDLLFETLRDGNAMSSNASQTQKLNTVYSAVQKNNITKVTKNDIGEGSFSSWIASTSGSRYLTSGFYPTLIYVAGNLANNQQENLNDPNTLLKIINANN